MEGGGKPPSSSPFCVHGLGSPQGLWPVLQPHLWPESLQLAQNPGPACPSRRCPEPSSHPCPPTHGVPASSLLVFWCFRLTAASPFLSQMLFKFEFCPLANCHLIFSSSWLKARVFFPNKNGKDLFFSLSQDSYKCSSLLLGGMACVVVQIDY